MKREAALCLLQGFESAEHALCLSITYLAYSRETGHISEDEYQAMQKTVSDTVSEISKRIMKPVISQHPDLRGNCCTPCSECNEKDNS